MDEDTAPRESDELGRAVAEICDAGPPGAHLSVSTVTGTRYDAVRGEARLLPDDRSEPLTSRHSHDLGSVTKIAGTVAMLAALNSTGAISLDSPIGRYVGELSSPLAERPLTELLRHRAGLWEWWPTYLPDVRGQHDGHHADPVDTLARLPLRYRPGTERHYSDLGFMLLGRAVTAVTGGDLPTAHRELVTGPLGIDGLRYAVPPAGHPPTASSHGDWIERRMVDTGQPYPVSATAADFKGWRTHPVVGEVNDGNAFHSFAGAAGHAGLFGTVDALHRLGLAMLTSLADGRPWRTMADFLTPGPDSGQLLGFRCQQSSVAGCTVEVVGHPGFPGVGFALLPAHEATVVLATNRLHVPGEPAPFEPLWQRGIEAAHRALHE